MDDMTAFERQVAGEFVRRAGPVRPVNAAAILAAITATQSPKWRFQSMFSAAKFVVAGAIVALFGGFLLAGLLAQPSDDMAPAAVTASPSPTTTEDLLSGMVTEEVEPGVYRVDSDSIRALSRPMRTGRMDGDIHNGMEGSIVAGLDGSIWWFGQDGFFRLGEPGVHGWSIHSNDTFDLEVGPDGTVWLARYSRAGVAGDDGWPVYEGEISSFDGESWSVHLQPDRGTIGVEVLLDGDVWGAWGSPPRSPSLASVTRAGSHFLRCRAT